MAQYLDTSSGQPEDSLGCWLTAAAAPGFRAFRCQTGFFSLVSILDIYGQLESLSRTGILRIVLGSNPPEQPTIEDVRRLLPLVAEPARTSLTVVSCSAALFHPKVLHIVQDDGSAMAYVGSANMTGAGLGRNIEAGVVLNSSSPEALARIARAIDAWAERREFGVYQPRTEEDLHLLLQARVLVRSEDRHQARAVARAHAVGAPRGGMPTPILWRPSSAAESISDDIESAEASDVAIPEVQAEPSDLPAIPSSPERKWCKRLRSSDAQQVRAGTNPTGKLRLSQEGFDIDQNRYFRDDFFGGESWASVDRQGKVYEECSVRFDIILHGDDFWPRVLRVDHAAHREAGQANVPTVLGWGPDLGAWLRDHSQVDNWLVLERFPGPKYRLSIQREKPEWAE